MCHLDKKIISILIIIAITTSQTVLCANNVPSLVTTFNADRPAYVALIPNKCGTKHHVAFSSFHSVPFSSDFVYFISNFSLTGANPIQRLDNTDLVWPNDLSYIDESIFSDAVDRYGGIFAPGGFLVPSKTNGSLVYYPFLSKDRSVVTSQPPIVISKPSSQNWFYHRVKHVDLSGDGVKDLLTCRAFRPFRGQTKLELVAFVYNKATQAYDEHVILNDVCDAFFDVADIDNDGRMEIVAAGFFVSKLSVIYSDDAKNSFVNGNVHVSVVDTNAGQIFDVKIVDLDLDANKKKELLVTNHQANGAAVKGSVFCYKLTGSVRNANWERSVIFDDFTVLRPGPTEAAPGSAIPFWPKTDKKMLRPYILVSGDGAEKAFLLEPEQRGPVKYSLTWSYHFQNFTVGGLAVADVDNDGFVEAFIPAYEEDKVYVFSFKPKYRHYDD